MMSALEQEIIEKFYQLDVAAQERVRSQLIPPHPAPLPFDFATWAQGVLSLRQAISAQQRGAHGAVDLLRALRDGDDE
jgi:hypothetical protein